MKMKKKINFVLFSWILELISKSLYLIIPVLAFVLRNQYVFFELKYLIKNKWIKLLISI